MRYKLQVQMFDLRVQMSYKLESTSYEFKSTKLAPVQSINDLHYAYFFYKQLESDLSPQSCLYFQGFRGSELLNGCLVV